MILLRGATLFFSLIFFLFIPAYALDRDQQSRFQALVKEIRCVVCQNQSIADSNAPLATDLREKVHAMIAEKKSDAEVKDYLAKRYGEFILLEPRFNKLTVLLWLFPFLGLTCIFLLLIRSRF